MSGSFRALLCRSPGRHRFRCVGLSAGLCLFAPSVFPCNSTSCLILTRGTAGLVGRGSFQVDLSFRHTDVSARRSGREPVDSVIRPKVFIERGLIVPAYHQDLRGSENALQLDVEWGASAQTTVFAAMPVFGQKSYDVGHGGLESSYSPRGIGDLVVGARHALYRAPQRSFVMGVGAKLPTGRNGLIDDFDETVLDPTLQPGTGSGDLIASLQWSNAAARGTQLAVSTSYQVNSTNDYRCCFGNDAIGAITASRSFGRFTPSLQIKLNVRASSRFVDEEVPSTGGTVVYLNAGLRLRSSDGLGFYAFFLVPAYRDVNDAQLAPRFSTVVGLSKSY